MNNKVLYPKLSYKITGLYFKVHNELGKFGKEKQCADRLEQLLKENGITYKREVSIPFKIGKNCEITGNKVDFLVENKIL